MSKKLGELLVKERLISPQAFAEAESMGGTGGPVRALIARNALQETRLIQYLSQRFSLPTINLAKFDIKPEVIGKLSPEQARKFEVIPIQSKPGVIVVAVADPTQLMSVQSDLQFATKSTIEAVLTTFSSLDGAFQKYYGGIAVAQSAFDQFKKQSDTEKKDEGGLKLELVEEYNIDTAGDSSSAPVVTLVNGVLGEAIRRGASDIHVEPYEKRMRVRLRVDGALIEIAEVPLEMKRPVTARFKIMSRMDIAETRVPQDGRIKLKTGGREIDFRVNTLPTLFGEKIVLRMLNKGNLMLDLAKLGFEQKQLDVFRRGFSAPNGMVLVTGPTGSGKTTTLYSALMELNQISDNVSTVEDPVEYNLEGINQVQIQKEVGLTFASALRSLLRQDPDSVLVGEIRDYETAEVAIQAALTGHLVLSTLHTNDAPSTVTRLVNMGVEPFLVIAAVNTIVAQRLLRRVCAKCKKPHPVPQQKLIDLGFSAQMAEKIVPVKGEGCRECNNSGYKGRVAIYEVMDFSSGLKEAVLAGASALELRKIAVKEGMQSLRMSALTKMAEGMTSLEEALSMTMEN